MLDVIQPTATLPEQQPLYKIGDIAKQMGMTLRALRYYEELGLIEPDDRSKGNFRLYHASVLQRIAFINSLKKLDFTLEEIRDVLGPSVALKTDKDIVARTRRALQIKKDKITALLEEMGAMNREVELSLRILEECTACKEVQNTDCDPHCQNKQAHL